jgi:hypothetical protein
MDESLSGVPACGPVADPDAEAIVVRQSRLQRDGLFGGLVAVFLVALVRGYAGARPAYCPAGWAVSSGWSHWAAGAIARWA